MMDAAPQNPPRSRGGGRREAADGGGAGTGATPAKRKTALRQKAVYEARTLRRTMSLPEVLLWCELRGGQMGVSFRKQHPIGKFKADFCCAERKLVVEVDGAAHDCLDQALHDEQRDIFIAQQGFTILRIPARQVLKDMNGALDAILAALPDAAPLAVAPAEPPLRRLRRHLPVNGEDL